MKKLLIAGLLLLTAGFAAFAGGAQESEGELSGPVIIAGSSTVYPVAVAVAEEFSKLHPNVEVPIQSTGSGGGFKNFFIPGKTDINNASRAIKDSELEAARENGIEPIEIQVAIDGITIVVNKAFPGDNITVEQLSHIWRPDNPAQKWSDVDPSWPDTKIELYGPTAASGTFDYFTDEIMGEEGASRGDFQKTEQDNTIVQAVAGSKNAMGYFGMAYYLENKDKIKALKVNGVMPSIETAKSGEYSPLSRPLFMYVSKKSVQEKPQVKAYVEYFLSLIDTDLIKEVGYVPMSKQDADAIRANYNAAVK